MEAVKSCRLCGSMEILPCLKLENAPTDVSQFLREEELKNDRGIDLNVYRCPKCGFVQLNNSSVSDAYKKYYDDYLMNVTPPRQMAEHQKKQARTFVESYDLHDKRVVDIGCGDGNYLRCLKEAGAEPTGIEPSRSYHKHYYDKEFKVYMGYVTDKSPVPDSPYDAFITRQVLEHIYDIDSFFQGVYQSVAVGGFGLIEVPSLEQTLKYQRYYDFFPDHLNYFSNRTLRLALEKNGFDIIDVKFCMNDEFLQAEVKKPTKPDFFAMQTTVYRLTEQIQTFVNENRSEGVAVWGAGGKGITSLAIAKVEGLLYVIDSDVCRQGRYTKVSHLKVVPPSYLKSEPVGAIIITAMAYYREILDLLNTNYRFRGKIAALGPDLAIVQ